VCGGNPGLIFALATHFFQVDVAGDARRGVDSIGIGPSWVKDQRAVRKETGVRF